MTKWQWILRQLTGRLWLRASVFCLIGVASALAGLILKHLIPPDLPYQVGADAVSNILNIIAASMLAVTTFSLNVMVSAYSAAASGATPRATKLLLSDNTAQNALSTFVGAFLFSIVGIVTLKIDVYGNGGILVLYIVTILIILFVVLTLLNWIEYLTRLGRVAQTIDTVEGAAAESIRHFCQRPYLGGVPLHSFSPEPDHHPVTHPQIGYIRYINVAALSRISESLETPIYLRMRTGAFNDSVQPLAYIERPADIEAIDKAVERIRSAFSIGGERSFEQDPRYGLIVLTEIASRALSSATNDSGTAIDVIGTLVRVLAPLTVDVVETGEPAYPNVHVPPILPRDIFEDTFIPIARDGASIVEISIRLQKALTSLAHLGNESFRNEAINLSQYALHHALAKMALEEDKELIRKLALSRQSVDPGL